MSASRIATSVTSGRSRPSRSRLMPDEHVVHAEPQVAQDRDALEGVDLAVEVLDLDAQLLEVVGQVLGHLLGQRRHEGALATLDAAADLLEQVVDLALGRADDRSADRRCPSGGSAARPPARSARARRARAWPTRRSAWLTVASNSSNVSGRLSSADGRRKPKSTRISLRVRSFLYMPTTCGIVMCDSSTIEQPVRREVVEQRPRPRARARAGVRWRE